MKSWWSEMLDVPRDVLVLGSSGTMQDLLADLGEEVDSS